MSILRKNVAKKVSTYIGTFLILVVSVFLWAQYAKAEVAIFYPTSCLGGWTNVFRAAGKPEVTNSNSTVLSRENSSILPTNTRADIFCGGFQGDLPEDSKTKKILLSFSWDVSKDDGPDLMHFSSDDFASATVQILDSTSTQTDFTLSTSTSVIAPATTTEVLLDQASVPSVDDQPISSPAKNDPLQDSESPIIPEAPANSEQSFLFNFFATPVFADETVTSTTSIIVESDTVQEISDTSTSTNANESISTPVESVVASSSVVESADTSSDANFSNTSGSEFLEISYTTDGSSWHPLGTVDREHLKYSVFEIPVPPSGKWSDMSNIQIAIKSIDSLDKTPSVYLDAMILQIEYSKGGVTPNDNTDTSLFVGNLENIENDPDGMIQAIVSSDPEQGETVVFTSKKSGSLKIYDLDDLKFSLNVGVGDQPVNIPLYQLKKGRFVALVTSDPNGCSDVPLEECLSNGYFIGKVYFNVVPKNKIIPVPVPVPASVPVQETSTNNSAGPVAPNTEVSSTSSGVIDVVEPSVTITPEEKVPVDTSNTEPVVI